MAGSLDHLAHLLPFRHSLVGSLLEEPTHAPHSVTSNHVAVSSNEDILRKFWEVEESPTDNLEMSPKDRVVVKHFQDTHTHKDSGQFIVPLPKKTQCKPVGKSRSQAVRRFLSQERTLHSKNQFSEFAPELVPTKVSETCILPVHVRTEDSTTTKLRVVFDGSATGISLVGPIYRL